MFTCLGFGNHVRFVAHYHAMTWDHFVTRASETVLAPQINGRRKIVPLKRSIRFEFQKQFARKKNSHFPRTHTSHAADTSFQLWLHVNMYNIIMISSHERIPSANVCMIFTHDQRHRGRKMGIETFLRWEDSVRWSRFDRTTSNNNTTARETLIMIGCTQTDTVIDDKQTYHHLHHRCINMNSLLSSPWDAGHRVCVRSHRGFAFQSMTFTSMTMTIKSQNGNFRWRARFCNEIESRFVRKTVVSSSACMFESIVKSKGAGSSSVDNVRSSTESDSSYNYPSVTHTLSPIARASIEFEIISNETLQRYIDRWTESTTIDLMR